ncbi:MAG: hypothetical protein Ct9H300mP4_09210 [Gammaproteobacteria bacterium]|nr:MAG: hypothetical protein Ct9H300mP4_09210 [Gammaproteobacteria bacterium]
MKDPPTLRPPNNFVLVLMILGLILKNFNMTIINIGYGKESNFKYSLIKSKSPNFLAPIQEQGTWSQV